MKLNLGGMIQYLSISATIAYYLTFSIDFAHARRVMKLEAAATQGAKAEGKKQR